MDSNVMQQLIEYVLQHTKKGVIEVYPKRANRNKIPQSIVAFKTKSDCECVMDALQNLTFIMHPLHALRLQINDIAHKMKTVLNPRLSQINKVITAFESNPTGLESSETKLHLLNIKQKQSDIVQQINEFKQGIDEKKNIKWEMMMEHLKRDIATANRNVLGEIMDIIEETECMSIQEMEEIIRIDSNTVRIMSALWMNINRNDIVMESKRYCKLDN